MDKTITNKIIEQISELLDTKVVIVGSVGMGIDIDTSDLDIAISVKDTAKMNHVKDILIHNGFEFRGVRPSTHTTSRFLLSKQYIECFVDVVILLQKDFQCLIAGVTKANKTLSSEEKSKIRERKMELKTKSYIQYETYKLEIYKRFCPELLWLTDIEICKLLIKQFRTQGDLLPEWLMEKINDFELEELL